QPSPHFIVHNSSLLVLRPRASNDLSYGASNICTNYSAFRRRFISVCSFDQLQQSRGIDVTFRSEFHMAHELASAFQQALGIGNLGATKEPDINVSFEGIDIGECRITYARGRMAIMQ